MKILLQHTGSQLFYKGAGVWVSDESEARPFNNALEAIEFCKQQGLVGLEIVLRPDAGNGLRLAPIATRSRPQPPAP